MRRFEDSVLGKLAMTWPLLTGLALVFIAAGGYLATIKAQSDHLGKIDAWIAGREQQETNQRSIIVHITDLEDAQERRITVLENNFDRFLQRVGDRSAGDRLRRP